MLAGYNLLNCLSFFKTQSKNISFNYHFIELLKINKYKYIFKKYLLLILNLNSIKVQVENNVYKFNEI